MAHTSEIDNVPGSQLGQVIQDFGDAGASGVTSNKQSNGSFTVIATFDDPPPAQPGPTPGPSGSTVPPVSSTPSDTVLQRDGIPWVVTVDGDDLVVRNILATCFGGEFDSGDDGETESGVMNDGFPTADAYPKGVALPIRSTEAATRNSPLAFPGPHIPWMTTVKVWQEAAGEQTAVACILIDNGPDVATYPTHALDLNPNVALHFSPASDPKTVADEWSGSGFSYRIVGGAKYIS